MGYDATRRDGHCLAPRSHRYHHLRALTTRQPRSLPRFMSDRRAPRHLRSASRSNRQHRSTRAQIRYVTWEQYSTTSPPPKSLNHLSPLPCRKRSHPEGRQRVCADSCGASSHDPSRSCAHPASGIVHTDRRDARRSHRTAFSGPVHRSSHPAREQRASARDPAQYADTGDGSCRWDLRDIP